ncbi:Isochorismatase family protein 1B [Diplodia seriata]|uniref:Isochorismatase family protein 1B n=1 Tax=Diplodia seriata TaxID=420778 RepID=A0A1S8B5J0_9PEZI|nr:Isochorismatase family protein 1B [Diplodia seriata]
MAAAVRRLSECLRQQASARHVLTAPRGSEPRALVRSTRPLAASGSDEHRSICDLQEKFRPAIWEFSKVLQTTQKMLRASQIMRFPVLATTQNRARLGETCSELRLDAPDGIQTKVHVDKTLFSMLTPEVRAVLTQKHECIIVGIESHICVTQTALELLREGHKVYVLADGVSSCNKEEVPIALARLRHEGVVVTTSESLLFELISDAAIPEFKEMAKLVKETKESTSQALQTLCRT